MSANAGRLNDNEVAQEMNKMVAFIKQEALEKARETKIKVGARFGDVLDLLKNVTKFSTLGIEFLNRPIIKSCGFYFSFLSESIVNFCAIHGRLMKNSTLKKEKLLEPKL